MISMKLPDVIERQVKLVGLTDIMFDRYAGDNKTQLPVEAKMYFTKGSNILYLPAINIQSFLSAKNTTSVSKMVGGKQWGSMADAMLSYVQINPQMIPLTRDGQPIEFTGFTNGYDEQGKIYVHKSVARLAKGIPNPKERPTVELPWELEFNISLIKNDTVDETLLQTAFIKGGLAMGLGTFRGLFGKFQVIAWDPVD
jgi:hypothetical protein